MRGAGRNYRAGHSGDMAPSASESVWGRGHSLWPVPKQESKPRATILRRGQAQGRGFTAKCPILVLKSYRSMACAQFAACSSPTLGGVARTGQSPDWTNPEPHGCPGDAGVANRVGLREGCGFRGRDQFCWVAGSGLILGLASGRGGARLREAHPAARAWTRRAAGERVRAQGRSFEVPESVSVFELDEGAT